MRLLHVVAKRGGGVGRYLSIIERAGERIWEVGTGPPPGGYDALILHGVVPHRLLPEGPKLLYLHGLRAVSRRIVLGEREFNPLHILKLLRFRRYLSGFSGFLFPSGAIRRRASRIYGVGGEVVYLPFDIPLPEGLRTVPRGGEILWVGRRSWIKGLDTLLQVAGRLPDWNFRVVGVEGESRGNVLFLGRVSHSDLLRLYARATFTLITSYYESFSYVVLESASQGTPILVLRRAEGAAEILRILGFGRVMDNANDLIDYLANYTPEEFSLRPVGEIFRVDGHLERLREASEKLLQ
ncbi:MAG: glycosyltransferase family 4 protein [Thermotogae bacterium]|nr:glycosyltransferase family 4 protein [Thermotogota bacterium]